MSDKDMLQFALLAAHEQAQKEDRDNRTIMQWARVAREQGIAARDIDESGPWAAHFY